MSDTSSRTATRVASAADSAAEGAERRRSAPDSHPPSSGQRGLASVVRLLNRHPVLALTVMSAVVAAFHVDAMPISWHFFRTAGELVLNGSVLHVYSTHPQLQFGPFTFLVATPLSLLPTPVGAVVASLLMTGLGVATLTLMFKTLALRDRRASVVWWIGAAVALVAWAELAIRYGHLDDALALAFLASALFALRRGHPAFAALLLAGSVDAKPWAVPAVALLLLAERRLWAPLFVLWGATIAACWIPFLVTSAHMINAARFAIPIEPASTLSLLPVHTTVTPWWCRPAQLLVATGLAVVAVRWRSAAAAIAVIFAVRLGLDPSVKGYYDIELILGTVLCDLALFRGRLPWATLTAAASVYAPTYLLTGLPALHAWVRTAGLIGVTIAVLVGAHSAERQRQANRVLTA